MTKLKQMLNSRGMTQRELAKRLKMTSGGVNHACRLGLRTGLVARQYAKAIDCCAIEILEV